MGIKTGTTAWAAQTIVASGWYPPHVRSAEAKLRYYASRFPLVENDASYWAIPEPARVATWVERTPPRFTMNMKAHALLTGHYADLRGLPADIRESLPPALFTKPHVYPHDLGDDVMREIARRFHAALAPLHDAGKLGAVLFQFPVWFTPAPENQDELVRIADSFRPYRVAVELRNATWMSDHHRHDTLALFAAAGISYVCVDEPQGFVASIPPVAAVTADLAYVRMHGRNPARWRRRSWIIPEHFDYLYSEDELREWVPKLRVLADNAEEVHVLLNNCYLDHALRNARELADLLVRDQFSRASTHRRSDSRCW